MDYHVKAENISELIVIYFFRFYTNNFGDLINSLNNFIKIYATMPKFTLKILIEIPNLRRTSSTIRLTYSHVRNFLH